MAKQLLYDVKANEKILAGVNKLEKAVTCTLGPAGKNVIIDEYGSIHSTKDGVSVAKSITLKDPFENMGANAIKEVAQKSNDRVGDGTTTSTLLAAEIYRTGLQYVSLGANATFIKNGIKKAADFVVDEIKKSSKKIKDKSDLERVATVSANGDKAIGTMIADVMDKIGNDGTIKVENGNGLEMTSKIVEGMVIDQSYVSPYMVTNADTMEAELDNPFILIVNDKLSNIQNMLPCLNAVAPTGRPLLIIANDYADDILGTLIMNRMRPNGLNSVAIKSPSFGDNRRNILEDIAILCGGRVISDDTGTKLQNATLESGIIGAAKRVVITGENTVIIDGFGDKIKVEERANSLRKQIEASTDEYNKEHLSERLAKLTSGIGVISVGATTEAERKELRDRVDDAFSAAKAALREGIVAGGGSALLHIREDLRKYISENLNGDEKTGAMILLASLDAPVKKILENAGLDESYIANTILDKKDIPNAGYDVVAGQYVDMIEAGIIDPTEVVINEVKNSVSVASLLLTTECLVCEEPKDDNKSCPPMM